MSASKGHLAFFMTASHFLHILWKWYCKNNWMSSLALKSWREMVWTLNLLNATLIEGSSWLVMKNWSSSRVFHGYTTGWAFGHRTCHGYRYIPYHKSPGVIQNLWYLLYPQVIYITKYYKDTIVCEYWLLNDFNVWIWLLPLPLGVCFHSSNNIFKKIISWRPQEPQQRNAQIAEVLRWLWVNDNSWRPCENTRLTAVDMAIKSN